MKGYIYISGAGADPQIRKNLNDPDVFSRVPTLGACMPNIRRAVVKGDYIFVISGKIPQAQQYVVGGFKVAEKIDALAAFKRFPENRLREDGGILHGNVIVTSQGTQHPLDTHDPVTFQERVKNFIVGSNPLAMIRPEEVDRSRAQTIKKLAEILDRRPGNRVIDVLGRWSKLDAVQVEKMLTWLRSMKSV